MDEATFLSKYPFKNQPFTHQLAYLQRFWKIDHGALFAEMGTGKSFMLINNIAMLYDRGLIDAALVVAPKGVYRNWSSVEIPKHMPAHTPYKMASWSSTPRKAEQEQMSDMLAAADDLRILVMNVEAFSTEKGVSFARTFLRITRSCFMAVDESTTIKTPTAKRTKQIIKVGREARYRRIATGSPVTKSPLDLYAQCEFLDPSCLGIPSYYAFQNRYAVQIERRLATHTFKQIVGYRNLDELKEKLDQFSFRVTKEECLDLPDKVYSRRDVELTPDQKKYYDQMKLMALSMFEDGSLMSTNNALTQLMRLHQICCGHIKLDDGRQEDIPSNRIEELKAVLAESSGKVIIWANYRRDIENIKLALQKEYGMTSVATYFGDTEAEERQTIVEQFQDLNNELRFFVGNPRTGGYGLTLTATLVVYYSNSFDLEIRLQSEDRAHRIGQTSKVTYVDLITRDTVDEYIVKALRNKINIASKVLGEELKEWLI